MRVVVRSAFSDLKLEDAIQKAIEDMEDFYLCDVKYSTCFDVSNGEILRSAVLIFEEYDEDDE